MLSTLYASLSSFCSSFLSQCYLPRNYSSSIERSNWIDNRANWRRDRCGVERKRSMLVLPPRPPSSTSSLKTAGTFKATASSPIIDDSTKSPTLSTWWSFSSMNWSELCLSNMATQSCLRNELDVDNARSNNTFTLSTAFGEQSSSSSSLPLCCTLYLHFRSNKHSFKKDMPMKSWIRANIALFFRFSLLWNSCYDYVNQRYWSLQSVCSMKKRPSSNDRVIYCSAWCKRAYRTVTDRRDLLEPWDLVWLPYVSCVLLCTCWTWSSWIADVQVEAKVFNGSFLVVGNFLRDTPDSRFPQKIVSPLRPFWCAQIF